MDRPRPSIWDVISVREARLLFWLVTLALIAVIVTLSAGLGAKLAEPAVILFIAWLMAYVLQPVVDLILRHLPVKSRGLAVAITYLLTVTITFVVLLGAGLALLQAAVAFVDRLPEILSQVGATLRPILDTLGIRMPGGADVVSAVQGFLVTYGGQLADAARSAVVNLVALVAALFTAVIISVGLAVGQVSLLGWLRTFLPESTYADLTALEQAIALAFGGFVRGRLLIGGIYGAVVLVTAIVFGVPFAPLIAVIAGLIVFIPWIGPLIGWAVLPAFALILAPDVVVPCLVVSLVGAVAIQVLVTQLVMGAAVKMSPVAVFAVVIIGASLAGIAGAVFAIPVAASILAITDYLRQRDLLLRAATAGETASPPGSSSPSA
jgi:predicted PurR-regulated permease PerM